MNRDINLNSKEWCDLVFEGKNREYGAYTLRRTSAKRHLMSLMITAACALSLLFLSKIQAKNTKDGTDALEQRIIVLNTLINEVKEENNIKPEAPKEIPEVKTTMKLTSLIKIEKAENIKPEDELKPQTELNNAPAIGTDNVKGTDNPNAAHPNEVDLGSITGKGSTDEIKEFVEIMPQFPGGDKAMLEFLQKNLRYPVTAIEVGTQGRVVLRFVVGKDGLISNVEVVRSLDPSCDREAIRVVKSMPKWIPGRQNGNPANVYFSLPVRFQLN